MAEIKQIAFTHKEVAEALVRQHGLHEGLWGLAIQYALAAVNVNAAPGSTDLNPAAVVPILSIGLQRFEELNNLAVDAAVVNPAPKPDKKMS